MKNIPLVAIILYFVLFYPAQVDAQNHCSGDFKSYYLNSNSIRASFFPRGNKFITGHVPGFLVPYPSPQPLSTIFASSPWLAGFDDAGNFKHAIETFPGSGNSPFSVGPLNTIGVGYDSICGRFDTVWNIFREDVLRHRMDYDSDGIIDDTIPSVFGWPARGNAFFSRFNGFDLPESQYASFEDLNGNNRYDPDQGEFPVVKMMGHAIIPDQMMWMVFNDVGIDDGSGRNPLRFEIQLTTFAFNCQDNDVFNNTVFNSYTINNRSVVAVDSVFFGMWTDFDLGCSDDDFSGSDSLRHTEFVYNADAIDGNENNLCVSGAVTFPDIPPVQSLTYLSHPMHSVIAYPSTGGPLMDTYNLLNGIWSDGTPMRPEGDGFNTDPGLRPTKFLFHGDPRDSSSWAAINVFDKGRDVKSVSSVSLGRLDPGARRIVDMAYMFHHDPDAGHLDQITAMYFNIDSLRSWLYDPDQHCTPHQVCLDDNCIWPGDFDKNGIADHRDYLTWGVLNGLTGPERNGLISWRGHFGEDWNEQYDGIDVKHGDGDGNGIIDIADVDINSENHLMTNRHFSPEANYPNGSEIVIRADPTFDNMGRVRNVSVRTAYNFENVLGITFTLEFDTSLFLRSPIVVYHWPDETSSLIYHPFSLNMSMYLDASFVQTNNLGIAIDAHTSLIRLSPFSFRLKPGASMPDSTVLRLRNLKAIDAEGNDLHFGSEPLVIYRDGFVSIQDPSFIPTRVYPNPTTGHLYIETGSETEGLLINLQGQIVRSFSIQDLRNPVDLSEITRGVYILKVLGTGECIKVILQ